MLTLIVKKYVIIIPLVMKLFTSVANDFQKISKHNYRIGRNRAVNIRAVARSFLV